MAIDHRSYIPARTGAALAPVGPAKALALAVACSVACGGCRKAQRAARGSCRPAADLGHGVASIHGASAAPTASAESDKTDL